MRLVSQFDTFLQDTVNLNQTRIDRLRGHVEAIEQFLKLSDYGAEIQRFSPQGSWAHKTIVKPPNSKGFDADLVMFVSPHSNWSAKEYVHDLLRVFKGSDRYKEKAGRGTRCITLDYAGDFHLDIVPCVVERTVPGKFEVCNRTTDDYEATASEAYTKWLTQRNSWTGRNMICKTIRLLKYLRDIKTTFSIKSILLTTLVGSQVYQSDKDQRDEYFPALPTSLKTLVGRLDDYLQLNPQMPTVANPVLTEEHFNRHWDQEKYDNFRTKLHQYREWIDDAYTEVSQDESIRKWRRVFGDDFAKGEVKERAISAGSLVLAGSAYLADVVMAVRQKGAAVLDKIPVSLPHVEKPSWSFRKQQISIFVRAEEYSAYPNSQRIRLLASGNIVAKERRIRFEARQANGFPLQSKDFEIKWQVVNTDKEAADADGLRGGFYTSEKDGIRWEDTLYRGVHWVEAFVISRRDGRCWGKSGRFFIVIE